MPRISTSSWSLHRGLGRPPLFGPGEPIGAPTTRPEFSLLELPERLVQAGIPTLEIVHFHFPTTDPGYIRELRDAIRQAGTELFSILIDAGDVTHPDPATRQRDMAWIRQWLDIAAQCGASHARVVGGYQPVEDNAGPLPDHPVIRRSAAGLSGLADDAGSLGLRLLTENFRETTDRADKLLAILELCAGKVGLCADFGNYRGPNRYSELAAIFPHAVSAHVKAEYDAEGELIADAFRHTLGMLCLAGFDGPMSLIFDGALIGGRSEWDNLARMREVALPFCAAAQNATSI